MLIPTFTVLPAQVAQAPIVNQGSNRVELRLPESGLFAGEAVDVEFRLSDLTRPDAIEGYRGIPNATVEATVTMPAMPGMPVVRPKVHREGVPGDYGVELFFPHGGDYELVLKIKPEGYAPIKAVFKLSVQDAEARKGKPAKAPFALVLMGFPKDATADRPVKLRLAVTDRQSGKRVTKFDIAHTKPLHLIVVSGDLSVFAHEHPVPQPDGSFEMNWTFPSGGKYLLFADVAPKDQGSQVLRLPVFLRGPLPKARPLRPTTGPVTASGIRATLVPTEFPVPIGRSTTLSFKLTDAGTGKPVSNLQPYLGALGHLMVVPSDTQGFVHSHPEEGPSAERLAKTGQVRFNARFPRGGTYKAWAQFQRDGKVVTLPFVFEVKA